VDQFLKSSGEWKTGLVKLRSILRSTGLEETVKWGVPVYTCEGKNVVGMGGFKSYFGLWFYQGSLLADKKKLLINAQEGRTKALRQMRFRALGEIDPGAVKAYVTEAIGLAERDVAIKPDRRKPLAIPPELQAALRTHKKAQAGFRKMTPGKQREYADYIASAKQDTTKQRRIDKILPMIESGIGLNEKYRGC
jgi:uncharacterized protein YdeI (YjbR/CyaY-like superfamily)